MDHRDLTVDMTLGLAAMRRQGIVYYPLVAHRLECGCRAVWGWNTETFQPFAGIDPCSMKHKEEARRATERSKELELEGEYESERLTEALAELLEEEIAAAPRR
jgi:hypothetical protein